MSEIKSGTAVKEMSVARGLRELKLLSKRIEDVNGMLFVSAVKGNETTTAHGYSTEDMTKRAKASLQSIRDLIDRRNSIKQAIVKSNASTEVEIGGKKYTVAEAIERKNGIAFDKMLLVQLKRNLADVKGYIEKANEKAESNLQSYLEKLAESDNDNKKAIDEISTVFRNTNCFKMHDPIGIEKVIEELENEITDFEADVDTVLSESNAITMITL